MTTIFKGENMDRSKVENYRSINLRSITCKV